MFVQLLDEFVPRHRGFVAGKAYEVQSFDRGDDSGAWVLLINENRELKWNEANHTRVPEAPARAELAGVG